MSTDSTAPTALDATAPASRVKSSASTASVIGYPLGHLGHLNDKELDALRRFKELLLENGLWKPGPPASHHDAELVRYLRARRWAVNDAYVQFKDTEDWRAANNIDVLYNTIDLDAYEESRKLYPQWIGRRDKRGIPIYYFEIRHLDSKTVAEYERRGAKSTFSEAKTDGKTAPGLLRLFALYENLIRFSHPFCTQLTDREHPDVPVSMSTNIVDIHSVGLKQFWNLKSHMQAASMLATAHYPETLDRIFIIGAPFFFSTVWGWIKRWFDPITVSKIFILTPDEILPTLEQFIDRRNIPKRYGGELDFEFFQAPTPDPAWEGVISWENGYSMFPTGPLVWEDEQDGERRVCIAVGKKDGKQRNERVCTLPKTFVMENVQPTSVVAASDDNAATETPASGATAETTTSNVSEATQTAGNGVAQADDLTTGDALEKLALHEKEGAQTISKEPAPAAAA